MNCKLIIKKIYCGLFKEYYGINRNIFIKIKDDENIGCR